MDYFRSLFDDVQQNRNNLITNDSQLARRNYLRSIAAFYELMLTDLRERTLSLLINQFNMKGKWDLHEIIPLLDDNVRLSENGKVTLDKNRYPFLSLFAYTVKTYSSLIEFEGNILSDHRWKAFSETVRIRHRITHPKLDSELEITDGEHLTSIIDGWDWFNDLLQNIT